MASATSPTRMGSQTFLEINCMASKTSMDMPAVAPLATKMAIYGFSIVIPLLALIVMFVLLSRFDLEEKLPQMRQEIADRREKGCINSFEKTGFERHRKIIAALREEEDWPQQIPSAHEAPAGSGRSFCFRWISPLTTGEVIFCK